MYLSGKTYYTTIGSVIILEPLPNKTAKLVLVFLFGNDIAQTYSQSATQIRL